LSVDLRAYSEIFCNGTD